eukprot:22431_1
MDLNHVTESTIDDILNEIDQNEQKRTEQKTQTSNDKLDDYDVNWEDITNAMRNVNIGHIKNLIMSNDIDINSQNPENGKTLLHYSVIIGNFELVQVICNFGADPHIQDNEQFDALYYAIQYGRYKITELLYYQQLSGSLGNDLKQIASKIHAKNKEANLISNFTNTRLDTYKDRDDLPRHIVKYMIEAIKNRSQFGEDMLYYSWYLVLHAKTFWVPNSPGSNYGSWRIGNSLESDLWKQMMQTYEEILTNTNDKEGWKWLKTYFINSLIWFLPHPNVKEAASKTNNDKIDEDDANDMETILQKTMFWELLIRVRKESKKQSDLLLKEQINKVKAEKMDDWNQLTQYNVNTKYSSNARQDKCGCIVPKFKAEDLSEEKYP